MKKLYITITALILTLGATAQSFEWVKYMRTNLHFSNANRMATDNAGNVYVCGEFKTLLTIDGDTLSTPSIYNDLSLSKFSPGGTLLWNKQFGSCYIDAVRQMAVDDAGHIYVSIGQSQCDSLTFEDTTVLIPFGTYQLLQFDNNGNYLRHYNYPDRTIHVATLGNDVYISHDDVVAKLDSVFNIQWSRSMSAGGIFTLSWFGYEGDLYVSPTGRLVMTGMELDFGTIQIDTLSMTFNGGYNDIAILVMDTSGSALWARILPATNQIPLKTVACAADDNGNVYWATQMADLLQFGSSTLSNPSLLNYSALLKYDASGNEQWAVGLYPNNGAPVLHDIVINSQQEAVVAGEYAAYSGAGGTFGGIQLPFTNSPIISKVDPSGNVVWIKTDNAVNLAWSSAHSIALMTGDKIAVVGQIGDLEQLGCFISPLGQSNWVAVINENPEPVPVVGFEYVNEGGTYYFHNTTTNGGNTSWNFGDGNISTSGNPTHSFGKGTFNVCLTSTNSCGTDTYCDTIIVPGINHITPDHIANSGFHLVYIEGGFNFSSAAVTFQMGGNTITPDSVNVLNAGLIVCRLKLNGAFIGTYDVIISSGSFADTLFQSLHVELPTPEQTEITINAYRFKHLINTHRAYSVTLVNHSNQTLVGVPFYLLVDDDMDVIVSSAVDGDSGTLHALDSLGYTPYFVPFDAGLNTSYEAGYFMVHVLEPEKPYTLKFFLRPTAFGTKPIHAFAGRALYDSLDLVDMGLRAGCDIMPKCLACFLSLPGFPPGLASCLVGIPPVSCRISDNLTSPLRNIDGLVAITEKANTLFEALLQALIECGGMDYSDAVDLLTQTVFGFNAGIGGDGFNGFGSNNTSCWFGGSCDPTDFDDWVVNPVASLDPNGKSGPQGITAENYINNTDLIEYSIYFENADTASVPATFVELFDTLDVSRFDMSSFRFSGFGFANRTYPINIPDFSFVQNIDLRPAKNSILRVMGSVDTITGIMKWGFYSLDTLTLVLNEDPDQGFLNPNVTSPEGEGFISFSLLPKALVH